MKEELNKTSTWEEQFELLGADGIDFVPLTFNPCCTPQSEVHSSFTKEEFLKGVLYPRSNYYFWKNIMGLKCYLVTTNNSI